MRRWPRILAVNSCAKRTSTCGCFLVFSDVNLFPLMAVIQHSGDIVAKRGSSPFDPGEPRLERNDRQAPREIWGLFFCLTDINYYAMRIVWLAML